MVFARRPFMKTGSTLHHMPGCRRLLPSPNEDNHDRHCPPVSWPAALRDGQQQAEQPTLTARQFSGTGDLSYWIARYQHTLCRPGTSPILRYIAARVQPQQPQQQDRDSPITTGFAIARHIEERTAGIPQPWREGDGAAGLSAAATSGKPSTRPSAAPSSCPPSSP